MWLIRHHLDSTCCPDFMGVHQLWKVVEPTARPVLLESLRGKTLAIDASIWIYHFIKAMRDSSGNAMRAGHIIGFFRRICKLLFYEIKPVFIFDGAAPAIKKITTERRRHRAHKRREGAKATANRLLTLQLQLHAKKQQQQAQPKPSNDLVEGFIPENVNYMDQGPSNGPSNRDEPEKFMPQDQYDLPDLEKIQAVRLNDQRLLSEEELDEYARQFTSQARNTGFIDTNTIDFQSDQFKSLPIESQYQLLNEARLKSRLRMGYTSTQLGQMFPNSMEFSKFQIERVSQRNFFTQKIMNLVGFEDNLTTQRVNSEKGKQYTLKKENGGYIMSLGTHGAPNQAKPTTNAEDGADIVKQDSGSEDEFEEVDLNPAQLQEQENISTKEPDFAELFGWESEVQRQQLYRSKLTDADQLQDKKQEIKRDYEPDFIETEQIATDIAPPWFFDTLKEDRPIPTIESLEDRTKDENMGLSKPTASLNIGGLLSSPSMFSTNTPVADTTNDSQDTTKESPSSTQQGEKSSRVPAHGLDIRGLLSAGSMFSRNPSAEPTNVDQAVSEEPKASQEILNMNKTDGSEIAVQVEKEQTLGHDDIFQPDRKETTYPYTVSSTGIDKTAAEEAPAEAPTEKTGAISSPIIIAEEPGEPEEPEEPEPDAPTPTPFVLDPGEPEPELEGNEKELADQEAQYNEQQDEDIQNVMVEELEENNRFVQILSNGAKISNNMAEIDRLKQVYRQEKRDADNVTEDMVLECMQLLQMFGIPYITAPGEAEAQCAKLYDLKLVDGIVTDDGDCFLFGNVKVYRHMFNQAKYVEAYDSLVIAKELGLDRSKLIELAFLLGSDYTDGIVGIGPVTGVELLADFGNLREFRDWWNHAQRYPDDANVTTTVRKRFLKKFSSKIFLSENFPDELVSDSYWNPNVDPDDSRFEWGTPDVGEIRKYMNMTSGWDNEAVNKLLMPVIEEQKRRDMLKKQQGNQSTLDEFAQLNKRFKSKRAAAATDKLSRDSAQ